jgi:hypothetical protein
MSLTTRSSERATEAVTPNAQAAPSFTSPCSCDFSLPTNICTPSTLPDLPLDIHILIIEHIALKSDLQSLYLVSKASHDYAVRRLHYNVDLFTWEEHDVAVNGFIECAKTGAQRHLRYTRHLTFESDVSPSRHCSPQVGRSSRDQLSRVCEDTRLVHIERIMNEVLSMFPKYTLLSFAQVAAILHLRQSDIGCCRKGQLRKQTRLQLGRNGEVQSSGGSHTTQTKACHPQDLASMLYRPLRPDDASFFFAGEHIVEY